MRFLKNILPLELACSFLLLACFPQSSTADDLALSQEIEQYLAGQLDATQAPSLSVAIALGGELICAEAVGYSNLENAIPADASTRYRTGSIAKVISAVATMKLVEDGTLSLQQNVYSILPEFPRKTDSITIEQLLSHTSGIRHYTTKDYSWGGPLLRSYSSSSEALSIFAEDPLLFEPGRGYGYSTYGYTLLEACIEKASGKPFATVAAETVWQPAGMVSTGLELKTTPSLTFATGYFKPTLSGRVPPAPPHDVSYKHAGGGMLSTPSDLVRFAQALHAGDLLKPESLERMLERRYQDLPGAEQQALAWRVSDDDGELKVFAGGTISGFVSYLVTWPERELSIAVMVNQNGFSDRERIVHELADIILAREE